MKKQLIAAPKGALMIMLVLSLFIFTGTKAQHITLNSYNNQTEIKATGSVTLTDGFHIPAGKNVRIFTGASFQECVPFLSTASTDQNYVSTKVFKVAGVDHSNINNSRSTCEVNQTIQYFDGLGRPLQTVTVQGSPSFKDVVQPVGYDAYGRESLKYLPYTTVTGANGSFKPAAISSQAGFYASPPAGVAAIGAAFAETRFEASPLNRVLEQGAPGASWQIVANNAGHTQKIEYGANNSSTAYSGAGYAVRLFSAVPVSTPGEEFKRTLSGTGYYAAGELYLTISKDENWTATKAGTTEEYKDKEGRILLKRTFNLKDAVIETLSTYYVYDELGNLSFVLPPGANPDAESVPSQSTLDELCYQYRYDGRKRLIEKKLPGKGWEHMVYNKLDQLVLSQDAMQRTANEWLFTKYDALGRVVMTGLYADTASRGSLAGTLNSETVLWETRSGSGTTDYDNASFPQSIAYRYTLNYYDDYNFAGNTFAQPDGTTQMSAGRVKGLQTGSFVYLINSSTRYLSVNYYDAEGRIIKTAAENHLGGTDIIDNTWNFAGELTASTRTHTANGVSTSIATRYEYDHMGRKRATFEDINNKGEVVLSKLSYNEIGQLLNKDLHSTDNGANFIQNNSYAYNERGWMSRINDPNSVSASKVFGMELIYANKPDAFNGNIGSLSWQTMIPSGEGLSQQLQSFSYNYDKLNRLEKAAYTSPGKTDYFNEELSYDPMGNITSLTRRNPAGNLNVLSYNYINSGVRSNKLWDVTDAGSAGQSSVYDYDENGNQKSDSRKGITIAYNYLNLPQTVSKASTGESINYLYDAAGRKLRKTFGNTIRDYVGGIEYSEGAIDFIQTEEGRALPGVNYSYEYMLKDHLGNTRATVNGNGEIVQIQDYYAFGMEMNPGNKKNPSPPNLYTYNGKELQKELGLDQLDYGARFYDPVIGRFNTMDPLSEKFYPLSGYSYVANNPILLNDPTGKDWTIKREQDKEGNITITMTLTLAVYNGSKEKFNSADLISAITSQLESTYSEEGNTTGGNGKYKFVTNIDARSIDDIKDRKKSEHLLEISDGKDVSGLYGKADKIGGKKVSLNSKYVQNMIDGKDNNTIPHEFGHTLGLLHPDEKMTYLEGVVPWNTRNQHMSGSEIKKNPYNIMYSGDSGLLSDKNSTKITRDQIWTIFRKYTTGSINKD